MDRIGPQLNVFFFRSGSGSEPVREWLKSLPTAYKKAIGADIKTVQFGWPIGMPVVRKMAPDLWEVRSHIPEGIARVLFTLVGGDMVLLHGFVKKTQATPKVDLALATVRMREVKT